MITAPINRLGELRCTWRQWRLRLGPRLGGGTGPPNIFFLEPPLLGNLFLDQELIPYCYTSCSSSYWDNIFKQESRVIAGRTARCRCKFR